MSLFNGNLVISGTVTIIYLFSMNGHLILPCQPRVTVTSYTVYKVIRDLESIDHLFINPFHRIGLIHKRSFDSRSLK